MNEKIYVLILGSMCVETFVMLIIAVFNLIRTLLQKTKRAYGILEGILFIIEYVILQIFFELLDDYGVSVAVGFENSTIVLILLQAAVTAVVLIITQTVYRWERKTLSKAALKNGLDNLPEGLLFYWKGGMVKLVNTRMYTISHKLFGEGIYSGIEFWKKLVDLDMNILPQSPEEKNECLVRLDDGSVYSFKRDICIFEDHEIYEIIASDVSEAQLLNEKLKVKRIKADEIKQRLKILNSEIEKMTAEKEILDTKSKVHDDLGKTLIMSRRFLETGDEKLGADVIKQWKLNTILLRGEENDEKLFEYTSLAKDIQKLGLELKLEGELPKSKDMASVVASALRTCSTNARRHGEATELSCRIETYSRDKKWLKIEISNDGKMPGEDFSEGGGLTNLRNSVERIGGSMEIEIDERFRVILLLPNDNT